MTRWLFAVLIYHTRIRSEKKLIRPLWWQCKLTNNRLHIEWFIANDWLGPWSIISFNRSKKLRTSSFQWCNRMPCLKLGFWIVSVYLDLEGLIANLATLDSQYQPSKISVDLDNSKLPVLNIASHCITGKMKYVVFSTCILL